MRSVNAVSYTHLNAPQRGSDLQYNLTLTFEEAAFGCRKEFKFQRGAVCKACAGTGAKPGTQPQTCPTLSLIHI